LGFRQDAQLLQLAPVTWLPRSFCNRRYLFIYGASFTSNCVFLVFLLYVGKVTTN